MLRHKIEVKLFQSWLAINKTVPALVQAFGEHLTYSLFRALRVFLIDDPSLSTPFPYRSKIPIASANSSTSFVSCGLACPL